MGGKGKHFSHSLDNASIFDLKRLIGLLVCSVLSEISTCFENRRAITLHLPAGYGVDLHKTSEGCPAEHHPEPQGIKRPLTASCQNVALFFTQILTYAIFPASNRFHKMTVHLLLNVCQQACNG